MALSASRGVPSLRRPSDYRPLQTSPSDQSSRECNSAAGQSSCLSVRQVAFQKANWLNSRTLRRFACSRGTLNHRKHRRHQVTSPRRFKRAAFQDTTDRQTDRQYAAEFVAQNHDRPSDQHKFRTVWCPPADTSPLTQKRAKVFTLSQTYPVKCPAL